ncbi:MAG: RidA family protein [Hyphomonadaceae bacterium]
MPVQRINPDALHTTTGYSHVSIVPAGRQVYVAGQVAIAPSGELVGKGDLAEQAEQVFANLKTALAAGGTDMARVYRIVTYVVDLTPEKMAIVRAVRARHMGEAPFPSSVMLGVQALAHPDLMIEIEATAALD